MPEVKAFDLVDFDLTNDGDFLVAFARLNEIDHDKDVTFPGAVPKGRIVPVSDYGHTSWPERGARLPTGKALLSEDGDLALAKGGFFLKTTQGANAYETVKAMGDVQQWSYGFDVMDFEPKPKSHPGARRGLKALDIHEISPVLLGAGKSTATLAIKELDDDLLAGSFLEQADRVLAAAKDLNVRESEIIDLRLKEGRKISADRRKRLEDFLATMQSLVENTAALLAETEVQPKEPQTGKSRLLAAQAELRAELVSRGYGLGLLTPQQ